MDLGGRPVSAAASPALVGAGEVGRSSRRRRPSGRPPPLSHPLQTTGIGWLIGFVLAVGLSLVIFTGELRGPAVAVTVVDDAVVRWLAGLDGPGLSATMKVLAVPGSWPAITVLVWGLLLALIVLRRLRHLLVVVAAWTLQGFLIQYVLGPMLRRPRPFGVVFRTDWYTWALPSEPMAALAVTLVGILYALVPEGRWRHAANGRPWWRWRWSPFAHEPRGGGARRCGRGCGHRGDDCVARLSVVHPERGVPGDLPAGAGRPLGYRWRPRRGDPRGTTRSTRVGRRGGRTVRLGRVGGVDAAAHQTASGPSVWLFGKLYARSHLRADRWYKLGRELLYGRLEDEKPFPHGATVGAAGGLRPP